MQRGPDAISVIARIMRKFEQFSWFVGLCRELGYLEDLSKGPTLLIGARKRWVRRSMAMSEYGCARKYFLLSHISRVVGKSRGGWARIALERPTIYYGFSIKCE